MKLLTVAIVLLSLTACAPSADPTDVQTAEVLATDAAPDSNPDAGVVDARPDNFQTCHCDWLWSRGPEAISCFTRGDDCTDTFTCVPIIAGPAEPTCVPARSPSQPSR